MKPEPGSVRRSEPSGPAAGNRFPIALFWDQSLVWGLICVWTLRRLGRSFHLLSADDIARGRLAGYRVLVVPGGWAVHKLHVLGQPGRDGIVDFIETGGGYLGFCGGAGLALMGPTALGLVPLERLPLEERLPSASGEVWIRAKGDHPIWKDLPQQLPVSIWWPGQFRWQATADLSILAEYEAIGDDFWVADLPLADVAGGEAALDAWERAYGINLKPARLLGHPAILEARLGRGRLILCYPHLETPGSTWGNRLLENVLDYLDGEARRRQPPAPEPVSPEQVPPDSAPPTPGPPEPVPPEPAFKAPPGAAALNHMARIETRVEELIRFGERHLLWTRRSPWLLNWRRGIRGLEYGTLAVTVQHLANLMVDLADSNSGSAPPTTDDAQAPPASRTAAGACADPHAGTGAHVDGSATDPDAGVDPWLEPTAQLEREIERFCELSTDLLLEEKRMLYTSQVTKLGRVNDTVDRLRSELFGRSMGHGGRSRPLFDLIDRLLLQAFRARDC